MKQTARIRREPPVTVTPAQRSSATAWCVSNIDGLVSETTESLRIAATQFAESLVQSEAVHRLRVALRRLDAVAKACRPLLGTGDTAALRGLIRPLRAQTGVCRDCDVGLELLAAMRREGTPCRGLAVWLRARRADAVAGLRTADLNGVVDRLTERWLASRSRLERSLDSGPARGFATGRLKRSTRRAQALFERADKALARSQKRPDAGSISSAVHDLRLAVKSLRYRLNAFAPIVLRRDTEELSSRLETAQDDLGKAIDAWRLAELAGQFEMATVKSNRAIGKAVAEEVLELRRALSRLARQRARKGLARTKRALKHAGRTI